MARFSPQEDAVLLPYVARPCDWGTATAKLPQRSLRAARQRLSRLRMAHGTLGSIDRSEQVRNQRREGGRFA